MASVRNPHDDLLRAPARARGRGRLRHPGVAELDRHVANALAKPTPRGWRLTKSAEAAQIDACIALAMAAERASTPAEPPAKLLGWI